MKLRSIKILQEAQEMLRAWNEIDSTLRFGDLTPGTLEGTMTDCRELFDQYNELNAQIKDTRTRLGSKVKELVSGNSRVHQGIRASYGRKSPQYERTQKARVLTKAAPRRNSATTQA